MQLKFILSLGLLSILAACTKEPDRFSYAMSIKNDSGQVLHISTYSEGVFQKETTLDNNSGGVTCSYSDERFRGYSHTHCGFDSLIMRFDNSKGYLFSLNYVTGFEFTNYDNHPFGRKNDKILEMKMNDFEFTITEMDFQNAHKLPE